MELGHIFFGNTPCRQRMALLAALKHLRAEGGFKRVIVPCCGGFASVKTAIEAGFAPSDIYASDVALFSNILGYLYAGKDPKTTGYKLHESLVEGWEHFDGDPFRQSAWVYHAMKVGQLRAEHPYESSYRQDLLERREELVETLAQKLYKMSKIYAGLNYDIRDMREVLEEPYSESDIVIVNPPAFAKGYTKMYDFRGQVEYKFDVAEWDWKSEFVAAYNKARTGPEVQFWYRYENLDDLPHEDVVFGRQYGRQNRIDWWLCTKAHLLPHELKTQLEMKRAKPARGIRAAILPKNYTIRPDSKITFLQVDNDQASYYRDLWAHKLGSTAAESSFAMLIDGFIFGIAGFYLDKPMRLVTDSVREQFGFNVSLEQYPHANRLLMMAITTEHFRNILMGTVKTNRYFELNKFRTVCLSKYRKLKANNGLLKIVGREKLPDGRYSIMYETEFWKRDLKQVITDYLEYEKAAALKKVPEENDDD